MWTGHGGSSPWTNGGGSAQSRREKLGSKGEMRGTYSKGLWGVGGAGKGMSAVASGETSMARALGSNIDVEGSRGLRASL
jgi:hypothetical protein